MNKIQNLVAYFCVKYPHPNELSNARITKMVYLADWFSSLINGKQLTDINWLFNHYGPYVDDVINCISKDMNNFKIQKEANFYGSERNLIQFIGDEWDFGIKKDEMEILDLVINKTKDMYFRDFINYIYSTYPIRNSTRYSTLELPKLAKEFIEENSDKI